MLVSVPKNKAFLIEAAGKDDLSPEATNLFMWLSLTEIISMVMCTAPPAELHFCNKQVLMEIMLVHNKDYKTAIYL